MPALLTLISCPIAWWLLIYPLRSPAHRLTDLNEQLSSEITRRASLESKLRHQALHDSLTDLPNRALFVKRLQASLRRKKKSAGFAVLFIDLDRFKAINDSLGHAAGDQVLVQIAKRLESIVRPADLLARVGGDEFTLLLEEMLEPGDAAKVAERIVDHLSLPLSWVELETEGKDPELHLTASIGIAWGEPAMSMLTNCFAMPTSRCTGQNRKAGADSRSSTQTCTAAQSGNSGPRARYASRCAAWERKIRAFACGINPSFLYPIFIQRQDHGIRGAATLASSGTWHGAAGRVLTGGGADWINTSAGRVGPAASVLTVGEWFRQTSEPDRDVTMTLTSLANSSNRPIWWLASKTLWNPHSFLRGG
jgi:diguanylate cyclase (GGDEF)-like protein